MNSFAKKNTPLNWPGILFLSGTFLGAITLVPLYIYAQGFSWALLGLLVLTYSWSNLSITAGYHRLFAHRAYAAKPWVEWLLLIFGAAAFQGPVLQWCTDHRRHHHKVDTEQDPYNIHEGFWYAHLFWMFFEDTPEYKGNFAPDLVKNPRVAWQAKYYVPLATFMSFGVPTLIGWSFGAPLGGLLIGGVLRQVLSQHSTFFINSLCHYFGGKPYNDEISARDNMVLAFLTFGEGYHNYHHAFQADYRNGIKWYHWDPTKWFIKLLALAGVADRLKRVQPQEILKARLQMEEKRLLRVGAEQDKVQQLKSQVEEAFVRWKALKEDYALKRAELRRNMLEQIAQIKRNHEASKENMRKQIEEWRAAYRNQVDIMRADIQAAQGEFRQATARWRMQLTVAAAA